MNTSKKAKVSGTPVSTPKLKSQTPKTKTPAKLNSQTPKNKTPAKLNSQTPENKTPAKQNGNTSTTPASKTPKVNTPKIAATPKSIKKITPQIKKNIIEEPIPKKFKSDLSTKNVIPVKQTQVFSARPVGVRHSNAYRRPTFPNNFGRNMNNNRNARPIAVLRKPVRGRDAAKVILGNLSSETTIKDLQETFLPFGSVNSFKLTSVNLLKELNSQKKININGKKFQPQGVRITGYANFNNEEDAIKALVVNGNVIKGYHIVVKSDHIKRDLNLAVYVDNLPEETEDEVLWKLFEDCGQIINVFVFRAEKSAKVYFQTSDAVELALGLDGCEIENCKVKISKLTETSTVSKVHNSAELDRQRNSVFLHSIAFGATAFEIGQFFRSVSTDVKVIILKNKATGQNKGCGYVNFNSAEEVQEALKLDGKILKGRPLGVKPIVPSDQRGLKRDANGAVKNTSDQVEAEESDNENEEDNEEDDDENMEEEDGEENVEDDEEEEEGDDEENVEDGEEEDDDENVEDEEEEDNNENAEDNDEEENNEDSDVSDYE